jgi:hypothetical protein
MQHIAAMPHDSGYKMLLRQASKQMKGEFEESQANRTLWRAYGLDLPVAGTLM